MKREDMTKAQLMDELIVILATRGWHDLSDDPPDPEAVACYGMGVNGGNNTIHILSKYDDGELVLAAKNDTMEDWKRSRADQFKLTWLWDQVVESTEENHG